MNTRERYLSVMTFESPGSLKWEFGYWAGALRRWYREGLPRDKGIPDHLPEGNGVFAECAGSIIGRYTDYDVHNYLHLDPHLVRVPLEMGAYPQFEEKTIEDHGDWYIWQDPMGCWRKDFKSRASLPSFVRGPVRTREDWEKYKAERLKPVIKGRLPANWADLIRSYKTRDYPLALGQLQGFFGTPRSLFGVEELLLKYYEDPELMLDINAYLADFWIALFEPVLREVQVDAILIWEDMCYRSGPLISPEMFRKFILPGYKKVTSFAREQGIRVINVDSDGDVWKLIPLWVEGGVTVLYPFEVASGMNVVEVRERLPKLGMMGGIDKRALIEGKAAIDRELESKIPFMLKRGGFIPTIDHLVPPDVPFEHFKYYREKLNRMIEKQTTA